MRNTKVLPLAVSPDIAVGAETPTLIGFELAITKTLIVIQVAAPLAVALDLVEDLTLDAVAVEALDPLTVQGSLDAGVVADAVAVAVAAPLPRFLPIFSTPLCKQWTDITTTKRFFRLSALTLTPGL
jgi:hypothetical protein